MPSPIYERLPQDGGHDSGPSRTEPSRPSIYYGDGPFDPPSSDDESDELLEKNGLRSPGNVERGRLDVEDTEGEGLMIRGQNQRPSSLRVLIYSLLALVLIAGADIDSGLNTLY
jgi:dipeptidyl aminopeptidase